LKVAWTPEAEAERLEIGEYIVLDNPRAAVRMDSMFEAAVLKLADFPRIGRPGVIAGTRELIPHESYRIVYENPRRRNLDNLGRSHRASLAT
jgi:addiction module RelE/StbE family toxin